MKNEIVAFKKRDFKGSRLRCLLLTHRQPEDVAAFFEALAAPYARVAATDLWAPRGFLHPEEAKLGETPGFLPDEDRRTITEWWLAKPNRANTPNWDLACSATIGGRRGLILIEAKAHEHEMADDRCGATNRENYCRIASALKEATAGLNTLLPGFVLSADSHYQLGNRFAFAWKLATMGIPVVLVYLGFLNATEMASGGRRLLRDQNQWHKCVVRQAGGTVPGAVWGQTRDIGEVSLTVLIRSAEIRIDATTPATGGVS